MKKKKVTKWISAAAAGLLCIALFGGCGKETEDAGRGDTGEESQGQESTEPEEELPLGRYALMHRDHLENHRKADYIKKYQNYRD